MRYGKKLPAIFASAILIVSIANVFAAQESLYENFQNPPAQARPFVRWWWNGARVTSEEVVREINIMHDAGIGGFEMNTIAMPRDANDEAMRKIKPLTWLSPEWNEVVKTGAQAAKKLGMIPDLIVGSGWPFGGRFLESGEQIQIVTTAKRTISGPGTFSGTTKELAAAGQRGRRGQTPQSAEIPKVVFLRLVPDGLTEFQAGIDLSDKVKADGTVTFEIPQGNHTLYTGFWREGYINVTNGAPGADGPVLNHLDKASVRKYLDRMSNTLNPALGGKLGNELRAMFCDSLELGGTNWCADFPQEFEKRRGYSCEQYLHFMTDTDPIQGDTPFADTLRRLRYDFNITLIELFMERFVETYTQWCHDNGVKSRMQAYGRESHPLDTSFLVDIPECETWIRDAEKTSHPSTINRFVASAVHLSGKTEVSCEAMTNTVTVFRILPEYIKRTDDLNFISGVTHSVLHGFNYMPLEAGFPGWVQYGCYFNEKNPWWPYFRLWSDYNARVSSVLQNSLAQASVAILTPDADIWSTVGRPYHPFAERNAREPWYMYRLWEALHKNGYNTEYTSDKILAQAKFDGGKIRYAQRSYDVLICEDVVSMLPQTAKRLSEYAKTGGKIIFVGQAPSRSPSFKDAQANDKIVKDAMAEAISANPKNVTVVNAPTPETIIPWAGETMAKMAIEPDVKISPADPNLSQIYHKQDKLDIFFFAWSDMENPVSFTAEFKTGDKTPWRWNPETGERTVYAYGNTKNRLNIHLEPLESLLLVFEPAAKDDGRETRDEGRRTQNADDEKFVEIKSAWQANFLHRITKVTFDKNMDELIDIGKSDDKSLNSFAGTITYRCEFEANDTTYKMLDLGTVHGVSEVIFNGKNLGVRWYGKHIYDTAGALKTGKNSIEIKVTTHLGNYARTFERNSAAGRWAWWFPIEPMGLLGPVKLKPVAG